MLDSQLTYNIALAARLGVATSSFDGVTNVLAGTVRGSFVSTAHISGTGRTGKRSVSIFKNVNAKTGV